MPKKKKKPSTPKKSPVIKKKQPQERRQDYPGLYIDLNLIKASEVVGKSAIESMIEAFSPSNFVTRTIMEDMRKSYAPLQGLLETSRVFDSIHKGWMEKYSPMLELTQSMIAAKSSLQPFIDSMQTSVVLADLAAAKFSAHAFASTFPQIDLTIQSALFQNLDLMQSSFKGISRLQDIPSITGLDISPVAVLRPPQELFLANSAAASLSAQDSHKELPEESFRHAEIIHETCSSILTPWLGSQNNDWGRMLEGARQAIGSDNPEKSRHSIVSLRELIRDLMHFLAPDADVKTWTQNPDDFHNGRPTRRTRLRYALRNYSDQTLHDFIEHDLSVTLEFLDLLQGGTHDSAARFNDDQLRFIFFKAESFVAFVIQITSSKD